MFQCKFCNKEYSTKGILKQHQTTTKKCLEVQNLHSTTKCKDCEYTTNRPDHYESHISTCKFKIMNEYAKLQKEYSSLQSENILLKNENSLVKKKQNTVDSNIYHKLLVENKTHLNTILLLETQVKNLKQQVQEYFEHLVNNQNTESNNTTIVNNNQTINLILKLNDVCLEQTIDPQFTLEQLMEGVTIYMYEYIKYKHSQSICNSENTTQVKSIN